VTTRAKGPFAGPVARLDALEGGKRECAGLSGSRLRRGHDVATCERLGDGGGLHGCRLVEAQGLDAGKYVLV
jgi:hypothetical protein